MLTEEMLKNLPLITEEEEQEMNEVEANFEKDVAGMLESFHKEIKIIDKLYESTN
ncbi:MAG: hypothetical protein ACI3Y9_03245 [Candidatus Cryptobacteroides sp.]